MPGAGELRQDLTLTRASSAAPLWSPHRRRADPPIARAGGELGAGEAWQAALMAGEGARRRGGGREEAGATGTGRRRASPGQWARVPADVGRRRSPAGCTGR
jgi:hypothetical protein